MRRGGEEGMLRGGRASGGEQRREAAGGWQGRRSRAPTGLAELGPGQAGDDVGRGRSGWDVRRSGWEM